MVKIIRDAIKEEDRNFRKFMTKNGWQEGITNYSEPAFYKPKRKGWFADEFGFMIYDIDIEKKGIGKIILKANKETIKEIVPLMKTYEINSHVKIEIIEVDDIDEEYDD